MSSQFINIQNKKNLFNSQKFSFFYFKSSMCLLNESIEVLLSFIVKTSVLVIRVEPTFPSHFIR